MNSLKTTATHFRYKKHPGDLFRNTSVQLLPHPYKNQEDFWVWFHPFYHRSEDISDLGDLYKQLHDTPCQETRVSSKNELCYSAVSKERLFEEIKSLEQKIYQDCFENFYLLIIEGRIELLESHQIESKEPGS